MFASRPCTRLRSRIFFHILHQRKGHAGRGLPSLCLPAFATAQPCRLALPLWRNQRSSWIQRQLFTFTPEFLTSGRFLPCSRVAFGGLCTARPWLCGETLLCKLVPTGSIDEMGWQAGLVCIGCASRHKVYMNTLARGHMARPIVHAAGDFWSLSPCLARTVALSAVCSSPRSPSHSHSGWSDTKANRHGSEKGIMMFPVLSF